MMHELSNGSKVVGTKQTLRALEQNEVKALYIANNAEKQVILRVVELAMLKNIPISYVETMKELGNLCNVEVQTATAALI